jgi:UDP-N-acetylglucosamine 1-carboxyvinyltransferase
MNPSDTAQTVWKIDPAGPLVGDVHVSGSKNAVTKHMVAALLAESPSRIHNAPRVGDVDITGGMLTSLGAGVEVTNSSVAVDPTTLSDGRVPVTYTGLNRIPILLLGPLLHRVGEAFVPLVGGDRIGARPVDLHMEALKALGAEVQLTEEGLEAKASHLVGGRIRFPFPSVGATENVLLTAVLAEGRTILENAAIEPEVVELALFLQRMGARIELRPDRRFVIEGVDRLVGAVGTLGGDRIEAFAYLVAGLATGGRVRVFGCHQDRLVTAITTLQRTGATFEITDEWIAAEGESLIGAAVQTRPHPGFMTDWHPPLVVLFTQAQGMSVMHETVFEDRFPYVEALRSMGAEIEVFDQCLAGEACRFHEAHYRHSAVIRGASKLHGAELEIPDVRGGFACLIAAAAAEGASTLTGVQEVVRGHDDPFGKFSSLGLEITPAD